MTDYDTQQVYEATGTTIRITPRSPDGTPDHPWAFAFEFPDPMILATMRLTPTDSFTRITRSFPTTLGAFIADGADPHQVQGLAHALWQRRHHGAAVETWAHINGTDNWMYTLAPAWVDTGNTDRWTVKEPSHRYVSTVGKLHKVDNYPWPEPCPLDDTPRIGPSIHYLMAVTPVPPPAPGYTNLLTA